MGIRITFSIWHSAIKSFDESDENPKLEIDICSILARTFILGTSYAGLTLLSGLNPISFYATPLISCGYFFLEKMRASQNLDRLAFEFFKQNERVSASVFQYFLTSPLAVSQLEELPHTDSRTLFLQSLMKEVTKRASLEASHDFKNLKIFEILVGMDVEKDRYKKYFDKLFPSEYALHLLERKKLSSVNFSQTEITSLLQSIDGEKKVNFAFVFDSMGFEVPEINKIQFNEIPLDGGQSGKIFYHFVVRKRFLS